MNRYALTRRAFLVDGAKAASILALGCGSSDKTVLDAGDVRDAEPHGGSGGTAAMRGDASLGGAGGSSGGSGGSSGGAGTYYDDDGGSYLDDDAGERCLATRADIEGPFFKPSSPETPFLLVEGRAATSIIVRGKITDGSCRAIEGAIVDFWQADETGAYDDEGFLFRGHQRVGADGLYQLTTIIPGRYLNGSQYRPAHLHCKVYVEGRELLTTQLYFEGDPFNEVDPWFSERTMLRPRAEGDVLVADFDFSVPA